MRNADQVSGELAERDDEIDLLAFLGVLLKYKWFILVTTFVAAAGAVAFSILSLVLPPERSPLPNLYRPSALIMINDEQPGGLAAAVASSGLSSLAGLAGVATGGGYGDLAVKLVTNKAILDTIAEEFDLARRYEIRKSPVGNTRKAILNHLTAEFDLDTGTLTIAFEDLDPQFAQRVVNRIVEILDRRFASIGVSRNLTQKNLLEAKLAEVEAETARLEAEIQQFQTRHGVLDVASLATEQITVMAQLRSQLILKEMEIKTYSDFARMDDPVIRRLRAERDNLLTLIKEMESGFSEYEQVIPVQKDLPKLALEFSHFKRDLLVQGKIFEILTQQYEITKLNVEGETPIIQVLDLADVPDLKSGPSRGIICVVTTFVAFFLSVIAAFVLNAVRNIKNDPERMRKLKG
jgi:uncharacterized protein involved in exopolysaccharide biosynthesis